MDTCMPGHKVDPIMGGIEFNGFKPAIPDIPGIGADTDNVFLKGLEKVII